MACINCKKNIQGEFINVNVCASFLDENNTSVAIPNNNQLNACFSITLHSDKKRKYKTIDLVNKPLKSQYATQQEWYFCCKNFFIDWLTKKISKLENPIN